MMTQPAAKPRVLFMCTGNSARSQMAEALLRTLAHDRFQVFSAGLEPQSVHPLTLRVLQEFNIDTSALRAKSWREMLDKGWFHYVIFVCSAAEQKCPTTFLAATKRLAWPFDDPAAVTGTPEEQLAAFRRTREKIESQITTWLKTVGDTE